MTQLSGTVYSAYAAAIAFAVIDTVALIIRILIRQRDAIIGIEDFLLLLGWAGTMAYIGLTIAGIVINDGVWQPSDPAFTYNHSERLFLKLNYFTVPCYYASISFTKLSIVFLYRRIFAQRTFRLIADTIAVLCFLWMVGGVIALFLYCIPEASFWDPTVKGHCYDFSTFFIATAVIEVVLDTVIIALPFPMIHKLQLSMQRKIGIFGVFALGLFVVATGIVRIVILYHPGSTTVSFVGGELWSTIQLSVALLCACALTYKPLLRHFATVPTVMKDYYSKMSSKYSSRGSSKAGSKPSSMGGSDSAIADLQKHPQTSVMVSSNSQDPEKNAQNDLAPDTIAVQHEWSVERV